MKSQNEVETGGESEAVVYRTDQPATAAVPAEVATASGVLGSQP